MIHMHDEGMIQKRALIKRITGHILRVQPLDEITDMKVDLDAGIVVIKMTVHTFQERRRSTLITGRGIRLMSFQRVVGTDRWVADTMDTIWDEDFEPIVMPHYEGTARTLADDVQQRTWERMAHRPGTSQTPLDSRARVEQGYSTDRMINHWG